MKVIIWIPARGGSTRIKKKNIKPMNGKPLVGWAIEAAQGTDADEIWLDSDSDEILQVGKEYGINTHERPEEYAGTWSMTEDALLYFTESHDYDAVIMLECTCPLINSKDIQGMIDRYKSGGYDSVTLLDKRMLFINRIDENHCFPVGYDPFNRKMSQLFRAEDYTYCEAGAYLVDREWLLRSKNRMGGRNGYWIKHDFNYDIDYIEDFKVVEEYMKWTRNGQVEMN